MFRQMYQILSGFEGCACPVYSFASVKKGIFPAHLLVTSTTTTRSISLAGDEDHGKSLFLTANLLALAAK